MTRGVLVDACGLIAWFVDGGATMTPAGLGAMCDEVFVSSITVWELTRKAALGKLPQLPRVNGSFGGWLSAHGFVLQPLNWEDAERSSALPSIHNDPMDRMLIAQAFNADRAVLTEDRLFGIYGVKVIW